MEKNQGPLGQAQARISHFLERLEPLELLALRRHFEKVAAEIQPRKLRVCQLRETAFE